MGIPSELKDICEAAGLAVRAGLVSNDLVAAIGGQAMRNARGALENAVPSSAGPDQIVRELLAHLRSSRSPISEAGREAGFFA